MTWTRETPTKEGYWWFYSDEWKQPYIVQIDKGQQLGVWFHASEIQELASNLEGYWSTEPIEVPEPPKEQL